MGSISLAFTVENAKSIIASGAAESGPYSHAEIANWCERFWNRYADIDTPAEIERIMPILADVESQWDMFVASEVAKNPRQPPSSIRAPAEWFAKWSGSIDA
jgi:hypothetical protein